ncbi:CotH kinase family protein [Clostridiales bacterium]|nr:CotH kinase family protein [Clostridiales bacterium]
MMYLILTAVFLTVIFRLKADAVKPAARAGILLLLVFCAAAVPAGGPALAEQAGPEVPAPDFSRVSGFYDDPFELMILSEEGLSVYYTRDGSIPDEKDTLYTGPLEVTDRSHEKNVLSDRTDIIAPNKWGDATAPLTKVDKADVIRAVAVDGQGNRSAVSTAVYFIGYQDKAEFYQNYKVISLAVDPGDLFDPARGIYVQGNAFDEWLHSDAFDPTLDEWLIPGNYLNRGREWERQARMQIFDGGTEVFSGEVGIRIHGGASRDSEQKSFNIYTRKEYGTTAIDYDLYDGENTSETGDEPITKYDSIILRNCGNDNKFSRIRDQLIQGLVWGRNFITQAMTPCLVFIDGEFWGHYEITEKLTDDFIHDHFGIQKKNVVLMKNDEVEEGTEEDGQEFAAFRDWIRETDFSDEEAYRQLEEQVDLDGLAEYLAVEFYICNWDFGDNNFAYWRARETDPDNDWADGKWRFILYDTEYSTGLYGTVKPDENAIERLREKGGSISNLFFAAMENPEFREKFADTYDDLTTSEFADNLVRDAVMELYGRNVDIILATYDRFWPTWPGGPNGANVLMSQVQDILNFFEERRQYSDEHVAKLLSEYR